jgi:hypothetical protein
MNKQQQAQVREVLDEELARLDDDREITEKLRQARAHAIAQRRPWVRQHAPALGWAMAAALLVVVFLPRWISGPEEVPVVSQEISISDLELVTQLEDFEQDMEFYYWLEEADATAG